MALRGKLEIHKCIAVTERGEWRVSYSDENGAHAEVWSENALFQLVLVDRVDAKG